MLCIGDVCCYFSCPYCQCQLSVTVFSSYTADDQYGQEHVFLDMLILLVKYSREKIEDLLILNMCTLLDYVNVVIGCCQCITHTFI